MSKKFFAGVTGVLFLMIAILHLLRLVYGWEVVMGGVAIPMWFSIIGVVVPGYLSYSGFRLRMEQ